MAETEQHQMVRADWSKDPVPDIWRDRGYTGTRYLVGLKDNLTGARPSDEQIATLKAAVPYECTPGVWLALAVEYIGPDPHLILVQNAGVS